MHDKNQDFNCLYIDSNRNFCVKRLTQLIYIRLEHKVNASKTLSDLTKQVKVVDCQNNFHLLDILFQIKKVNLNADLNQDNLCPNLLIIDNMTSLFSHFHIRNGSLDINYHLNCVSNQLKYLASNMNMAIVIITHNDWDVTYTYNSSSFYSILNFICLYNSTWKNIPKLVICLNKNSSHVDSDLNLIKFEIKKRNRNLITDPLIKNCHFKIKDSGLICQA